MSGSADVFGNVVVKDFSDASRKVSFISKHLRHRLNVREVFANVNLIFFGLAFDRDRVPS